MKVPRWLYHFAGCGLFLLLPFIFAPEKLAGGSFYARLVVLRDFTGYLLTLLFFYLNYFVLIPRFYFRAKNFWYIAIIVSCFVAITFLPVLLVPFDDMKSTCLASLTGHINHNLYKFLLVFFASLFWRINSQWRQTQQEKLKAQLSYLRGQINPHFLFNTLNSIYSMAIEKSDDTATALAKLSWMMRYVISESPLERVLLYKEINYIRSYVELQEYRFGHTVKISFEVLGDATGKKIAPIVLIPFVENAFKHGVNAEEDSNIKIRIAILKNSLEMTVRNNKVNVTLKDEEKSGLGIENTRNRLQLLYPERHQLKIEDTTHIFSVWLQLDLQ